MWLPRQDTMVSLSAEAPALALARDAALLDEIGDTPLVRWYTLTAPAVVLGLALHHRRAQVIDEERCRAAGVQVLERSAGGGAVLLDVGGVLCCSVCIPDPHADLTESYRWLGEHFARRLGLRRVEVDGARRDVAMLRERADAVATLVLNTCYGALSPHEVVNAAGAKVVGMAQVRRRQAALFQVGILLRDQSALADLLHVPDEAQREELRVELTRRSAGLEWQADLAQLVQRLALDEALQPPR
jgi:lipoate-protein ligase A